MKNVLVFVTAIAVLGQAIPAVAQGATESQAVAAYWDESSCAIDVFLHANHFKKSSKLNEKNYGLGFKCYHPDNLFHTSGEFFAEVGGVRNSQRSEAYFVSGGYTYKFFEMNGVRVSVSVSPTFINYGAKGRSVQKFVVLPFVSVGYGHWDMNAVYFPKHDGGFLLISAQYRFK